MILAVYWKGGIVVLGMAAFLIVALEVMALVEDWMRNRDE